MKRHHSFKLIALVSLTALPLGTIACSNGSSPTEPAFTEDQAVAATTGSVSSVTGESKGGGNDDRGGDNHGGKSGRGGKGGRGGQDDNQRAGKEFEGAVASVSQGSLSLAKGTRIAVNAQTQWSVRGDLRSLAQVADALAAHRPTRVEGRGTRQADGSILAQTLKAEVDD